MYEYKDYINQKSSVESKRNELLEGLKEIDSAFKLDTATPSSSADIKMKEYDNRTLDDIKEQAVALLSDYANTSKNSIENEYEEKAKNLSSQIESEKESGAQKKQNVSSYIENAKQSSSDDALKRGLARSSIVINQLNAFDKQQIEEFKKIDEDIANNLSRLHDEIGLLNQKKQTALDNFDITYAVKLNEKISQLSNEAQKYNDEVLEYNNKIAEQERAYSDKLKKEQDERNRDVYEFLNDYGGNVLESRLSSYRADYVINYLDSLPRLEALAILTDNEEIKTALGDNYYKVVSHFENKDK